MAPTSTIRLEQRSQGGFGRRGGGGLMAVPGNYTVTLSKEVDGQITTLSEPMPFEVVPLRKGALPSKSHGEIASFIKELGTMQGMMSSATMVNKHSMDKVKAMENSIG